MKTHLLASLLLLAAPVIARDSSDCAPCATVPKTKAPIAANATRGGKSTNAASLPAHHTYAAVPSGQAEQAKAMPAPRPPVKTARPGYLFM